MKKRTAPKVRKENLVVQELNGELLIYDLDANKAFCLNETSALIWQACDGNKDVSEIRNFVGKQLNSSVTDDFVWLALDQLKKENLIENKEEIISVFDGMSRREVIRKVGLASVIALPLVAGLVAPKAAMAGSVCGGTCTCTFASTNNSECAPAGTCAGTNSGGACRCVRQNQSGNPGNGNCLT